MPNDDVYEWLDNKNSDNEQRAIAILACRELRDGCGYSYREIAEVLGVSHMWVARALVSQTLLHDEPP